MVIRMGKSNNNWDGYKPKESDYDYVDEKGKGWRKKEGETLTELKKRAKGDKVEK